MAEPVGAIPRAEEEPPNTSAAGDPPLNGNAMSASPGCSSSPSVANLHEDEGSSAVPERLSVLSIKAVAQSTARPGPDMFGQALGTSSGLAQHHPAAVKPLGGSSDPAAAGDPQPVDIASPRSRSPCYAGDQSLELPLVPRVSTEPGETPPESDPRSCHTQQPGNGAEGDTAAGCPGRVIRTEPTRDTETLERKKQEAKERYRLQLAMYRRLLLLRSIRSLHEQLEQQQARLQECYGTVMNTRKEVLKHTGSSSTSPAP